MPNQPSRRARVYNPRTGTWGPRVPRGGVGRTPTFPGRPTPTTPPSNRRGRGVRLKRKPAPNSARRRPEDRVQPTRSTNRPRRRS